MSFPGPQAAVQENQAFTHPEHPDVTLRGRTYAIPFAQVWASAKELSSGGVRGWISTMADEDLGVLQAECRVLFPRSTDDIEIRISLDENAQTRVDMSSTPRGGARDWGRNRRRIRRFFHLLDGRIGAGSGTIIDPNVPLLRTSLVFLALLSGCGPVEETPPETATELEDSLAPPRNFQGRTYERHIVFLTFQGDSTLLVPFSFMAQTRQDGVDREVRGWLARSDAWDPFLVEQWQGPPNVAPWRILPLGPVGLVVGQGDALERLIFQEGGRNLELILGGLLVEWSGQRAQTYRVHESTLVLSDRTVEGHVLDMTRAWESREDAPGDWGILLSGDSLHLVMEDMDPSSGPEGGSFSVWARVEFLDRQWQHVRLSWSDVIAFEPARRDVPIQWDIQSSEDVISGTLTTSAFHFEAGEGEGPMLPVDALFQVTGNLALEGRDFPVRGFLRHQQR